MVRFPDPARRFIAGGEIDGGTKVGRDRDRLGRARRSIIEHPRHPDAKSAGLDIIKEIQMGWGKPHRGDRQ